MLESLGEHDPAVRPCSSLIVHTSEEGLTDSDVTVVSGEHLARQGLEAVK